MKRTLTSFVAGMLTAALIGSGAMTALASDNSFTLTAYPIQVLVNGQVFRPKDSAGNDALVFTSNGTTYAPLRALAEAYGLTVGYDSTNNLATVSSSTAVAPVVQTATVSSGDFASQWTVKEKPVTGYGSEKLFTATYSGPLNTEDFKVWWKSMPLETIKAEAEKIAAEEQRLNPGYSVTMYFNYGTRSLGTVFAFGDSEGSNFDMAGTWIK